MKYRDAETGQFVSEDAADADREGTARDGEQIITINDVRAAGHCVRGARDWFAVHGLDFADFLANGIDRDVFLATGDALAQQVVERVDAAHG